MFRVNDFTVLSAIFSCYEIYFCLFNIWFFLAGRLGWGIVASAVRCLFLGLNNLFVCCFNGRQKYSEYSWYSMNTAFMTASLTCLFSFNYGKSGAVYSIALAPAIAGFLVLFLPARFVSDPWTPHFKGGIYGYLGICGVQLPRQQGLNVFYAGV